MLLSAEEIILLVLVSLKKWHGGGNSIYTLTWSMLKLTIESSLRTHTSEQQKKEEHLLHLSGHINNLKQPNECEESNETGTYNRKKRKLDGNGSTNLPNRRMIHCTHFTLYFSLVWSLPMRAVPPFFYHRTRTVHWF